MIGSNNTIPVQQSHIVALFLLWIAHVYRLVSQLSSHDTLSDQDKAKLAKYEWELRTMTDENQTLQYVII